MCVCFFFKQKTAYEMRISDWSSDVCSSDLMLGAAMAGGAFGTEVQPLYRRDDRPQGVCHFFMAIDPERTIGREAFLDRMDALCAMMKTTPAAKADEPVLVPGEPEAAKIADCTANGVPLPPAWYEGIQGLARGARPHTIPPHTRTPPRDRTP